MSIGSVVSNTITAVFLLVILSYYALLLVPRRKGKPLRFRSITVIIPAHNEEKHLARCLEAVLAAKFPGKKQVIVVDDGSTDATYTIAKRFPVTVLRQRHSGKSKSINRAIRRASGELIAIVDGDSVIHEDAFERILARFNDSKVAAVCAVIKVENRRRPLGFFLHLEQLQASLTRALLSKVNSNIITAGPLSVYRKRVVEDLGGFGTKGFSEDADMAIRIIRAGYRIEYAEDAFTETNMPATFHGFIRQRSRFARGTVNILKRHFKLDRTFWQIYTLPLAAFSYLQAIIMGAITLWTLGSGYYTYFVSHGIWLSWQAARFFLSWFTVFGIVEWAARIVSGAQPLTLITGVGLAASLLTYPLYLTAVLKYDSPFSWKHLLGIALLGPFWMLVMLIYLFHVPEWLRNDQRNIWEKSSYW